jgi:hypothetical protein
MMSSRGLTFRMTFDDGFWLVSSLQFPITSRSEDPVEAFGLLWRLLRSIYIQGDCPDSDNFIYGPAVTCGYEFRVGYGNGTGSFADSKCWYVDTAVGDDVLSAFANWHAASRQLMKWSVSDE